ncbi:MAG: hypothetical protein IJL41_04885 [Clostridia bacterium]|nr:hypothetical protein [Clostridia bacterium]
MESDFGAKLRQILSDAEAMEKISAMASALQSKEQSPAPAPAAPSVPAAQPPRDDRAAFLAALRPLLREEKRHKIDALQNALVFAEILGSYKKHKTE